VWTGTEQRNFSRVIAGFESATGASVSYTAAPAGVPAALDARLAAHNPPDVAFLPQPGALRRYASEGALVPLDPPTRRNVDRNYSAAWLDLASVAGRPFGVWFKAADKSLVWYNVGAFENAGVVPPTTIDGLVHVARTLTSTGVPAFSVGGANPWTLDDWFANLYLRVAGPARYDLLAAHRLAWTDESVKGTLRLMSQVLSPGALAGGPVGALGMSFSSSVAALASDPPGAAMTSEAEFVLGALPPDAAVEPGRDIDVFPFPSVAPAEPGVAAPAVAAAPSGVVAGGDVAVALRATPLAAAFLAYLATPDAAARWASQGGFISPNANLDLAVYPDDLTRSVARSVLEAGDALRFGMADLQPPSFGANQAAGMQGELRAFLLTRDVDATASRLEQAARAAYRP